MIFRPDSVDKYLKTQANLIGFINSQKDVLHGECLGNFNVLVGDQVVIRYKKTKKLILALQDQFLHIWRYEGGYKAIDENMKFLKENKDYNLIMKDMSPLLRSRESELFLQFSFWPDVALRCILHPIDHNELIKGSCHSGRDLTYTSSDPTT